ncbi:MAG: type I 3-dehydroquinate dehydratase [Candidatus Hydrogenedentes bacterium]|nr:type I 3-dehydroquinate dehydratase [Candidatus Hydrogenedentota bacterium]
MLKLGGLELGTVPRVVAAVCDGVAPRLIADAKGRGVEVIEARLDLFDRREPGYVIGELAKYQDFPVLATVRSSVEGGGKNLSDEERLALYKLVIPQVAAVDIELSSKAILPELTRRTHRAGKLVLISFHDFSRTPDLASLSRVREEAAAAGADVVKVATLVSSRADLQTLTRFLIDNSDNNIVAVGMGPLGAVTRFLFPALGSLLTYTFLGRPTAPGQMDYKTTLELLAKLNPRAL